MSDYKNDMDVQPVQNKNLPVQNALYTFYPSKRWVDGSVDESMQMI